MRKTKRKKHTKTITKIVLFSGILIGGGIGIVTIMNCNVPEKRLMEYMKYIEKGEYEQMYAMLDQKKSSMNSKEEFIERNSKIYEGIEMSDLSITDICTSPSCTGGSLRSLLPCTSRLPASSHRTSICCFPGRSTPIRENGFR